jgi:hypothetical protein
MPALPPPEARTGIAGRLKTAVNGLHPHACLQWQRSPVECQAAIAKGDPVERVPASAGFQAAPDALDDSREAARSPTILARKPNCPPIVIVAVMGEERFPSRREKLVEPLSATD